MVSISQQSKINTVLRRIGPRLLKKPYADQWGYNNPTYGYCYILSEALYHYLPQDIYKVKAYCINLKEDGVHWYVTVNDEIVDLTGNQFSF